MKDTSQHTVAIRLRDILHVYGETSAATRLHVVIRYLTCPLLKIEPYVPHEGRILEIGCGHGLFTHILARASVRRELTGIDIAQDKIAEAEKTAAENVRFACIDFFDFAGSGLDAVVVIDVLYLLPPGEQVMMLKRIFDVLGDGGLLVLKTMDTKPRWKYLVNWLQETLAVRVFGITEGSTLTFRSADKWKRLLRDIGFSVDVMSLHRGYTHPHCVMVCVKK